MGFLAGLALLLLGLHLIAEGLASLKGRRHLLGRALALALAPVLGLPGSMALALGAGVGTSGALFWAALGGRPEGVALGVLLLVHRLVFSLPFPLLLPWLEGLGVVGLHLASHLAYALAFLFLSGRYEALAARLSPKRAVSPKYLSREALETPTLAHTLVQRELGRVADAVRDMLAKAVRILSQEEGGEAELAVLEDKVDLLTWEVVLYTAELSTRSKDERAVRFFVAASELEHLGDLVRRVVRQAEKLWSQGLTFSQEGKEDLLEAARLVLSRVERMAAALAIGDKGLAREVLAEGERASAFLDRLRRAHLLRLEGGRPESRATTLAHLDLLITLEELSAGVERLCRLVLEL